MTVITDVDTPEKLCPLEWVEDLDQQRLLFATLTARQMSVGVAYEPFFFQIGFTYSLFGLPKTTL